MAVRIPDAPFFHIIFRKLDFFSPPLCRGDENWGGGRGFPPPGIIDLIMSKHYILLFRARNKDKIQNLPIHLQELDIDLEQEDDAAGFLGVTLGQEIKTVLIKMKQTGLIQRVIEYVGLDDGMVKGEFKPSEKRNLLKDSDGEPPSGIFSCIIFFGMLIYLSGNTRPDI